MRTHIVGLVRCNRAATAIEYGLIIGCVALAIVSGVQSLGGKTGGMWHSMSTRVIAALS